MTTANQEAGGLTFDWRTTGYPEVDSSGYSREVLVAFHRASYVVAYRWSDRWYDAECNRLNDRDVQCWSYIPEPRTPAASEQKTISEPLYSVGTYDSDRARYSPQRGLSVPSFNITISQLRQAVRELRALGYSAHRTRAVDGRCDNNDSAVRIERTDGKPWRKIMREWWGSAHWRRTR